MSVHGPLEMTRGGGAFELSSTQLRSRGASIEARKGMLALCGVLVAGLVISLAAAGTDTLLPESVRPVPAWLAGPFGSTGLHLGVAGLMGVLALMFGCYAVAVRAAEYLSPRMVLMCIAALHALVLLAPPLVSTDIFSYQMYGRLGAMYHANPYLQGPHAMALDPLYPFIGAKWVTTPTVYGPVFSAMSWVLAPLSIAASVLAYKAIATIASLATVALVWNAARLRGIDPVKAAALVGLNPLLVVYGVGGGHNDLLMLAALIAGLYAVLQHRERAGGGMIAVAAGIKLTAGLYLPFVIAGERGLGSRDRRRDLLVGVLAGISAVAALGFAVFGTGPLHLLSTIAKSQSSGDWHSIAGFISTELGLGTVGRIAGIVLAVLFVGVFIKLVRRVWHGEMDWIDGAAWATVALLITASSMLPWYVAWLMPLAALATDARLWRASIVMTGVVMGIQTMGYIPHTGSLL
jgi:alpha-1,6-mannosyltransferase